VPVVIPNKQDVEATTMPKEAPREFGQVRYYLINMSEQDRSWVRKWVLRWVDENGKLLAPSSAFLYGAARNGDQAKERS